MPYLHIKDREATEKMYLPKQELYNEQNNIKFQRDDNALSNFG